LKISFDLDNTLICFQENAKHEPNKVPFFLKLWFKEPLRLGTCKLMKKLKNHGHEICIYTSSYRSVLYIRLWLCLYGIHIKNIVNQEIHNNYLQKYISHHQPSKNPRLFGIYLHIDDSEGVKLEGERYGFKVCVISPEDENWTQKVLESVKSIESKE
jgi:hypothetical protein